MLTEYRIVTRLFATQEESAQMYWQEIDPKDAVDVVLPTEGIDGPLNEVGEPCPWPWEPQQLVGVPLGQYHCPYCSAMVVAGVPHIDYREEEDAR